jgi:hypothetical protein
MLGLISIRALKELIALGGPFIWVTLILVTSVSQLIVSPPLKAVPREESQLSRVGVRLIGLVISTTFRCHLTLDVATREGELFRSISKGESTLAKRGDLKGDERRARVVITTREATHLLYRV